MSLFDRGLSPKLDQVLGMGASKLGTVRVRSALNPLLWLVGCTMPLAIVGALFVADPVARYVLLAAGVTPVVLAVMAACLFLVTDRDRLQSEEFILEQRRIAIMARKGVAPHQIEIVSTSPADSRIVEMVDPEDSE